VPSDRYVLTLCPATGGDLDPTSLRGCAIADAHARFRRMAGDDVLLAPGLDVGAARGRLEALGIGFDWERTADVGDPAIERWAQWLIGKLEAAKLTYQRQGEGWLLRSGKLHGESERRLDELEGWSGAARAGQRRLLEHVDDPGDSGSELEQSLSKLAASGWNVDAKKDKGPPAVFYAAGDMPLARGDDWRAAGAIHPRLAAALTLLLTAVPPQERADALPGRAAPRLPALAVVGEGADEALLDMRTTAKALREVGGLDLPSGEPLGPVIAAARLTLRAQRPADAPAAADGGPPARESAGSPANGAVPTTSASDPSALATTHGSDAVRFALLHAAAPSKRFRGGDDVVGYAARFLAQLRERATERLDGTAVGTRIDGDDPLRRRLAGWCDTAVARTAENYERLDMHRATRNAIELLARIEDFEARAAERDDGLGDADREAVAVALAVLAQLLVPLAPAAAAEVWKRAGRDGSPDTAAWPGLQREPAAA
jgi:hypothetical protein